MSSVWSFETYSRTGSAPSRRITDFGVADWFVGGYGDRSSCLQASRRYHPDNAQTGDLPKFCCCSGLETLSDPTNQLLTYRYHLRQSGPMPLFELKEFVIGIDAETNRRLGYCACSTTGSRQPKAGLSCWVRTPDIPPRHLVFTVHLKEKHYCGRGWLSLDHCRRRRACRKALPSNRLKTSKLRQKLHARRAARPS
jgi:hypothetical protein